MARSVPFIALVQEDHLEATRRLIRRMFKALPAAADEAWMLEEMLRMAPPVAGVTLLADLAYDARPLLPQVALPAGEFVAQTQPNARLLVFEESGHCFNAEVATFIAGL
jgi:hypothetical protein